MDRWNRWRQNRRAAIDGNAALMKGKEVDNDARTVIMIEVKDVPNEVNRDYISKGTEKVKQFIVRKILRGRYNPEDFELLFLNILKPGVRPKDRSALPSWDFRTADDFVSVNDDQWTDGLRLLRFLVTEMNSLRIPCRGRIREGLRHKAICNEVTMPNDRPDFLVVEGPRPRPLLGRMLRVNKEVNVGKYCLQNSNCPVMVFRFVAEEDDKGDTRPRQASR